MFVYISITGRYEAGLYQYVLYQLVSIRAGIKPDSSILYQQQAVLYKVLICIFIGCITTGSLRTGIKPGFIYISL